jgi:hypothetical protein
MKRFLSLIAASLLASLACVSAPAQAAVSVPLSVSFVLPTSACTTINGVTVNPCDNIPLTGANALTNTDIWVSLAPIPNNFTGAPTLSIPAGSTSVNTNFSASSGDTIYVRLKARTASASSASYSNEATKTVTLGAVPGNVTSVTLTINIS